MTIIGDFLPSLTGVHRHPVPTVATQLLIATVAKTALTGVLFVLLCLVISKRRVRILGFMRLGVIGKGTENLRVDGSIPPLATKLRV
jgi:hypothetical protein